jgi:hypothetical protein
MRKFSLPFNKVPFAEYSQLLQRYDKELVHSIYLSIPEIDEHLYEEKVDDVSKDLLRNTMDYKRMVVYNHGMYPFDDLEIFRHLETAIFPLIEKYRIDGFIITNVHVSRFLKEHFPNLELHLSCNNPVYTVRQALNWIENGKVDVINPPREIGRTPSLMKEFHEHGIKQKVLLNNACAYGCSNQLNHTCSCGLEYDNNKFSCTYGKFTKWLQNCVVLPRWMPSMDEYVSIYKIAGRFLPTNVVQSFCDAYILGTQKTYASEIAGGGTLSSMYQMGYDLPLALVPDKLRSCECRECESCGLCERVLEKLHRLYKNKSRNATNDMLHCDIRS